MPGNGPARRARRAILPGTKQHIERHRETSMKLVTAWKGPVPCANVRTLRHFSAEHRVCALSSLCTPSRILVHSSGTKFRKNASACFAHFFLLFVLFLSERERRTASVAKVLIEICSLIKVNLHCPRSSGSSASEVLLIPQFGIGLIDHQRWCPKERCSGARRQKNVIKVFSSNKSVLIISTLITPNKSLKMLQHVICLLLLLLNGNLVFQLILRFWNGLNRFRKSLMHGLKLKSKLGLKRPTLWVLAQWFEWKCNQSVWSSATILPAAAYRGANWERNCKRMPFRCGQMAGCKGCAVPC